MTSCKPVDTPISTSKVTVMHDCLVYDPTQFHQIIGALQYLNFTRPDICFAINRAISLCMLLQIPIRLSLNALGIIFGVQSLMAYISLVTPFLLYMALQM